MKNEVTVKALIGRINRKLGPYKQLRVCSERSRSFSTLGRYYINGAHGITEYGLDLEHVARSLGVMHKSERLSA